MGTVWSKEEELELERLAGDYPWRIVFERYNAWAEENGYVQRTDMALQRRANIIGAQRRAQGEWITIGTVSAILGIDREKPRRWLKWGKIRSYRCTDRKPSPHYVSRRSLQEWAKREPEFFRVYPWDALVLLFDNEHAANMVYEHPPVVPKTRTRAVRCVETGQVYRSVTEAARRNYVSTSRLQAIMNTHETAMGRHFVDAVAGYRPTATH
jgi:hypothetical protein